MSNAIEVRGLKYRAGATFSIQGMDLTVPAGAIYGFLGANGSGKTTTIRLMLGMLRKKAGRMTLLGHEVPQALPTALRQIGYVPERPHLYPGFSVDEAVRYHAAFYPDWDATWATQLRRAFDLPGDRRIGQLSKGETGKLMMLLALSQKPELLILDEPTDGLDPMIRQDVMSAVMDYVAHSGATVFISSHLVHELERMCDWVGVLDRGRLIAEKPIAEFKAGVKRVRFHGQPVAAGAAALPFDLLSRTPEVLAGGESWVVRGWDDPMRSYFDAEGLAVRDVVDLDLEEVFVEMLRAARTEGAGEVSR